MFITDDQLYHKQNFSALPEGKCTAFMSDGKTRCVNVVKKGDKIYNHCDWHHEEGKRSYLNYKKLCDHCHSIDLSKEFNNYEDKSDYIMKCYIIYNNAFHARMDHRNKYYGEEYGDEGHLLSNIEIKC